MVPRKCCSRWHCCVAASTVGRLLAVLAASPLDEPRSCALFAVLVITTVACFEFLQLTSCGNMIRCRAEFIPMDMHCHSDSQPISAVLLCGFSVDFATLSSLVCVGVESSFIPEVIVASDVQCFSSRLCLHCTSVFRLVLRFIRHVVVCRVNE